jgi:hypothetical protein
MPIDHDEPYYFFLSRRGSVAAVAQDKRSPTFSRIRATRSSFRITTFRLVQASSRRCTGSLWKQRASSPSIRTGLAPESACERRNNTENANKIGRLEKRVWNSGHGPHQLPLTHSSHIACVTGGIASGAAPRCGVCGRKPKPSDA